MFVQNLHWTVLTLQQFQAKVNPQPEYQRGAVWNVSKQQLLMDSMLRGYDIPKIYLAQTHESGQYDWEVVDGQQRITAVLKFLSDGFPLGKVSQDLKIHGDLSGRLYSELPSQSQQALGMFTFDVMEIRDHSEYEVRHLFRRLQEGVSLNAAEKRNAFQGGMRDFIADLGTNHKVFPLTKYNSARYGWHDLVAHVTRLELNDDEADVAAKDLEIMYEFNLKFDPYGKKAVAIKKNLNYLSRVLSSPTPEMDIKWGFVDLYWLISRMSMEYVIKDRESEFRQLYIDFEQARRETVIDDLFDRTEDDPWSKDLFDYIQAFQREGNKRDNIRKRHEVYTHLSLDILGNLIPLDPQRSFNKTERSVIWRRAEGNCAKCGEFIDLDDMHADHIVPHSNGGKTSLDNAQSLCARCNLQKSDSIPTT